LARRVTAVRGSRDRRGKSAPAALDLRSAGAWGDPDDSQQSCQYPATPHGRGESSGAGARNASGPDLPPRWSRRSQVAAARVHPPRQHVPLSADGARLARSRNSGVAAASDC